MNVDQIRARFSSLGDGFAYFDAPGGTQVPDEVGQAVADAMRDASGNLGAPYATGRAVEAILERAKADAGPVPRLLAGRDLVRDEHDDARLRALARGGP